MPKLTFGKLHKGKELSEVPRDYLEWLLTRSKENIQMIEFELWRRNQERLEPEEPSNPGSGSGPASPKDDVPDY